MTECGAEAQPGTRWARRVARPLRPTDIDAPVGRRVGPPAGHAGPQPARRDRGQVHDGSCDALPSGLAKLVLVRGAVPARDDGTLRDASHAPPNEAA